MTEHKKSTAVVMPPEPRHRNSSLAVTRRGAERNAEGSAVVQCSRTSCRNARTYCVRK